MTPKEKAKQLIDKYRTYCVYWTGGVAVENANVKQCALIAIDEALYPLKQLYERSNVVTLEDIDFLNKVKEEIINGTL